jgi:peptidoglycan/LPS O-acetylase OafA/YrhL
MGILRLVLALVVLTAHLGGPLPVAGLMNAGVAVQAFFIISGFYMALILETKYTSWKAFYTNRALRIYPIYFVVLILAAVALYQFNANAYIQRDIALGILSAPSVWLPLAIANICIIGQEWIVWFIVADDQWLLNPSYKIVSNPSEWNALRGLLVPAAWSLSLELMFYAIAPLLASRSNRFLIAILLASAAFRWGGDVLGVSYHLWPRRLFPAELCLFVLGMLAWRMMPFAEKLPRWSGIIALTLVLAVVATQGLNLFGEVGTRTVTYLVVASAIPLMFAAFHSSRLDELIGSLSYPIYISHILVISVLSVGGSKPSLWLTVLVTIAFSAVLLYTVDRPINRLRRHIARERKPQAASSLLRTAG